MKNGNPWEDRDWSCPLLETKDDSPSDPPVDTAEIKALIEKHGSAVEDIRKNGDQAIKDAEGRLDKKFEDVLTKDAGEKINAHITKLEEKVKSLRLEAKRPIFLDGSGQKQELTEAQMEHKAAFDKFFRKGTEDGLRDLESKALSVGVDPEGGYTVPIEMEAGFDRLTREFSNMRNIARVQQISGTTYKRQIDHGGATSGWVGERQARPETGTPTLSEQRFEVHELYANPTATQNILDDSTISIEAWLAEEVAFEFAKQEGLAFVSGDGVGKPKGFLAHTNVENDNWGWGKIGYKNSGASGGFPTEVGAASDSLIDLIYSLKRVWRGNAHFLMNDKTIGTLRKLKDADGNPLWHSHLTSGEPDQILGYRVGIMPDMPDLDDSGKFPIAFGNFQRGYLVLERQGTRVLRDPFTKKPYVQFYTTKRVGGGVLHYEAYKLLRVGT